MNNEAKAKIKLIDYNGQLTKTMLEAIDHIGRHRKTGVILRRKSCSVSVRTANKLIHLGYVMWIEENRSIMLTYKGERVFTALHPTSKWRIK